MQDELLLYHPALFQLDPELCRRCENDDAWGRKALEAMEARDVPQWDVNVLLHLHRFRPSDASVRMVAVLLARYNEE